MILVGLYLTIMGILTISDISDKLIPNLLVLPAILIGCYLTRNWAWAIGIFILGSILWRAKRCGGGDVKLGAMIGAYLGMWAIPTIIVGIGCIKIYRKIRDDYQALPVAPFMFVSSLLIVATIGVLHCVG